MSLHPETKVKCLICGMVLGVDFIQKHYDEHKLKVNGK